MLKKDTIVKAPLGALDAFKPTECNNWAHVLCSVFIPEVVFSDTTRLKTVDPAETSRPTDTRRCATSATPPVAHALAAPTQVADEPSTSAAHTTSNPGSRWLSRSSPSKEAVETSCQR